MAKKQTIKTRYVCQDCGYDTSKWLGRCPGCGAWGTLAEERISELKDEGRRGLSLGVGSNGSKPVPIAQVETEDLPRYSGGSGELDRVLGGGIIPGSVVLIAGDPGVGKSSLTIRVCAQVARQGKKVLYVTGEESARQVKMRADRLGAIADNLYVVSETNLTTITAHIENIEPELLVIDSVQTVFMPEIASAPGSVSQVRECAVELLRIAKTAGMALFVVGHVTKEGSLAGPRVLEHIVDTVLFFEGEKNAGYRILRAVKNRFGNTNEIGLFEMRESGLVDVPDASELFLSERADDAGSVIIPTVEGTRPLLVEIQSLVAKTPYVPPRRTTDAIDLKRLQLLIAVLEKRVNLPLGLCDVFVKAGGGIKIDEPAADLGLCVAMASSYSGRKPRPKMIVVGEVGLAGEVRAVSQIDNRLREASRLGFTTAIIPGKNADSLTEKRPYGIKIQGVSSLREALSAALPKD